MSWQAFVHFLNGIKWSDGKTFLIKMFFNESKTTFSLIYRSDVLKYKWIFFSFFLGATKHLYNWLCPLVCRSVCLSVTHSFDDSHVAPYWPTWPCFVPCGTKVGSEANKERWVVIGKQQKSISWMFTLLRGRSSFGIGACVLVLDFDKS